MKKFRRSSVANSQKPERAVSITQFFFQVRGSSTRSTTHEDCCTWLRAHEEVPESSVPDSQKSARAVSVPRSAKVVALMEHWFLTLNCDRIPGRDV